MLLLQITIIFWIVGVLLACALCGFIRLLSAFMLSLVQLIVHRFSDRRVV